MNSIAIGISDKPTIYYDNDREEMLKYVPKNVKKSLEIGCGFGGFSALLKKRYNTECWGIEIEKNAALQAEKKLDKVINEDANKALDRIPDNYFDCIILFDVIEHFVNPYLLLVQLKRKLSPDGVVITSIPNIRYWSVFKDFVIRGDWEYKEQGILDITHLRFFTRKSIIKMFKNCGFELLQFEGIYPTSNRTFNLINFLLFNFLADARYSQYVSVVKPQSPQLPKSEDGKYPGRYKSCREIRSLFKGQSGIEIGGLSPAFKKRGFLPLYSIVKRLDGCNFSERTLWEGSITGGETYNFYKDNFGVQYISEATNLLNVPKGKYDFVISSNCLEHIANPLKAVQEWLRVLKKGGLMLLVIPDKKYCFDHNRQVVSFSHLLSDYQNEIGEDDMTHLNEILALHDLEMDTLAGSREQFKARSLDNFKNRALHHHVFDLRVLKEIYDYFDLEILFLADEHKNHIILGRKKLFLF